MGDRTSNTEVDDNSSGSYGSELCSGSNNKMSTFASSHDEELGCERRGGRVGELQQGSNSKRSITTTAEQQQQQRPTITSMARTYCSTSNFSAVCSSINNDSTRYIMGDKNNRNDNTNSSLLVQNETKWLMKTRKLMILVLSVATFVSAMATYKIMRSIEHDDFKTRYNDFANEIITVSQVNAIHIFQTYESMSLQMTAYVSGNPTMEWPLVHFQDWGAMADQAIYQTGAKYIGYTPLVNHMDRIAYEEYSSIHQEWIDTSLNYTGTNRDDLPVPIQVSSSITGLDDQYEFFPAIEAELYAPMAQIAPVCTYWYTLNYNGFDFTYYKRVLDGMISAQQPVLSEILDIEQVALLKEDHNSHHYDVEKLEQEDSRNLWPASFMLAPIYDRLERTAATTTKGGEAKIVAALAAEIPWHSYFINLVPENINGIILLVENTCGQEITYQINGPDVIYLGPGDLHDPTYNEYTICSGFTTFTSVDECQYRFHIFPSNELVEAYETNRPLIFTITVVCIFVSVSLLFILYDWMVERRQEKVMHTAIRSSVIVNSLFPANVRDRIMDDAIKNNQEQEELLLPHQTVSTQSQYDDDDDDDDVEPTITTTGGGSGDTRFQFPSLVPNMSRRKHQLRTLDSRESISRQSTSVQIYDSKPIADLFPNSTVLFGDLVGFTAWSSVRQPSQVFTLLETLYNSFDKIARRRRVFKVETIGDCYVAATGLPELRDDHAVVMVRFANQCMNQLYLVLQELDRLLGPGTAELAMRFGIHSGPVTAGVLRGEKSRFQLFGDTVNTAARMESTGAPHRIHLSQQTADLLTAAGKARWYETREDLVTAKGKGQLQTYWLILKSPSSSSSGARSATRSSMQVMEQDYTNNEQDDENDYNEETRKDGIDGILPSLSRIPSTSPSKPELTPLVVDRMVRWNLDVLQGLLRKIVAMRCPFNDAMPVTGKNSYPEGMKETHDGKCPLDEVSEFISLPTRANSYKQDPQLTPLSDKVIDQLHDYIAVIASKYRPTNSFHSFGHACHVTQSVMKLLERIVTPPAGCCSSRQGGQEAEEQSADAVGVSSETQILHEYTYGITSDPLTQFACAFSAMIHDVDHDGVPNSQLVKEQSSLAVQYKNQSVAEQNSVDIAWDLLMQPKYADLRGCIYTTQDELNRFRQLVINAVMATDVMDKDQNALRRERWDKVFFHDENKNEKEDDIPVDPEEHCNRKGTIIIEHLIQASDVAHTMQHWHIYVKWNERLFQELHHAYQSGRAETDPAMTWYQGELNFFDYYVIPLAQKLKECGVFGVASDEYLTYAVANRCEWALKGKDMVRGYLANATNTITSTPGVSRQWSLEVNEERGNDDDDSSESGHSIVSC